MMRSFPYLFFEKVSNFYFDSFCFLFLQFPLEDKMTLSTKHQFPVLNKLFSVIEEEEEYRMSSHHIASSVETQTHRLQSLLKGYTVFTKRINFSISLTRLLCQSSAYEHHYTVFRLVKHLCSLFTFFSPPVCLMMVNKFLLFLTSWPFSFLALRSSSTLAHIRRPGKHRLIWVRVLQTRNVNNRRERERKGAVCLCAWERMSLCPPFLECYL